MDQNKIVGREIAKGKIKVVTADKKDTFIFEKGNYELCVGEDTLQKYACSKEAIEDCLKKLKEIGSYENLSSAYGYKPKDGQKNSGVVIVSDLDPRVCMTVQFGSKWPNDSDYFWLNKTPVDLSLMWFLDTDNLVKEMGANSMPERKVSDEELDLISKIRDETRLEKLESFQPMLRKLQNYKKAFTTVVPELIESIEDKLLEDKKMKFHEDFQRVDFFGLPLMEEAPVKYEKLPASAVKSEDPEKKDKEVEQKAAPISAEKTKMKHVGDALAEPESEAQIGLQSGEKELTDKEVKVGQPGEEDGKGEVVHGAGKSDDQQDELAKKEVKLGNPGEAHGKHMSEEVLRRRYARMVAENRMLKGKLSELLDRVTKIEESAKNAVTNTVEESKMGMARQRMELKKAGLKERMSEMKKPEKVMHDSYGYQKEMKKMPHHMAKEEMKEKDADEEMLAKKDHHAAKVRERLKAKLEARHIKK